MKTWRNYQTLSTVFVGFILAGCSGSPNDSNPGVAGSSNAGSSSLGGAGSSSTGGASAGGTAGGTSVGGDGPLACGSATCTATQFCVIPCCGGAAPACFPVAGDAGTCPAGSHSGCTAPASYACSPSTTCCQYNPCTPPSPYCSDSQPTGCFTTGRTCRMMCA